jgi:MoaA/NifB/PqqE/SkfB family radical SAM enzyme
VTEFKENFCMAPWVHMSVWQTGDAYPCCIYHWDMPVDNINRSGLKGAWNSEKMRELRLRMLSNEPSEGCKKCINYDKQGIISYRHKMNTEYAHHRDLINTTQEDGTVDKMNLAYFDIRFSNLCNMKCRSCGPHFSSKWAEDVIGKPEIVEINHADMWEEIEEALPSIEEIYFTGGESLFMPQHYRLLDMLIERGLKPRLTYNSNATRLSLKGKHIKDYWKHFDNIFYCVSLDQVGPKAEYTRNGQTWDTVYNNLCWIRDNFEQGYDKGVVIQPNPTISVLNIMDLRRIINFLFDNGLATDYDINMNNLLVGPEWLSCTILPKHLKQLAQENLELLKEDVDKRKMYPQRREFLHSAIDNVIVYMNDRDDTHLIPKFKEEMQKLDLKRGENFTMVFPELKDLYV